MRQGGQACLTRMRRTSLEKPVFQNEGVREDPGRKTYASNDAQAKYQHSVRFDSETRRLKRHMDN